MHDWFVARTRAGTFLTVDLIDGRTTSVKPSTHRDIAQAAMHARFRPLTWGYRTTTLETS